MRRVTRADRAANMAAHLFPEGYYSPGSEPAHWKPLRDKLRALGSAPDPDEVDKILDGRSDTWLRCSECGCRVNHAVELELDLADPPWEDVLLLCAPCAHAVCALAGEVR